MCLRTAKIGRNTLVGPSTSIEDGVQIVASVIGRNCTIGAGSVIRNSYIFDDTVIGNDCVVDQSIIGSNVRIKEKSKVPKGCLVGDGVVVGPHAILEPFERLSKSRALKQTEAADEDEDSDLEDIEARASSLISSNQDRSKCTSEQSSISSNLGKDSNAIIWPRGPPDDEEEDNIESYSNQRLNRIGA